MTLLIPVFVFPQEEYHRQGKDKHFLQVVQFLLSGFADNPEIKENYIGMDDYEAGMVRIHNYLAAAQTRQALTPEYKLVRHDSPHPSWWVYVEVIWYARMCVCMYAYMCVIYVCRFAYIYHIHAMGFFTGQGEAEQCFRESEGVL